MITLIGTGHVFDLSSALTEIFDEKLPEVICVELE
jgi:pheromone shutdown protein TraB